MGALVAAPAKRRGGSVGCGLVAVEKSSGFSGSGGWRQQQVEQV